MISWVDFSLIFEDAIFIVVVVVVVVDEEMSDLLLLLLSIRHETFGFNRHPRETDWRSINLSSFHIPGKVKIAVDEGFSMKFCVTAGVTFCDAM